MLKDVRGVINPLDIRSATHLSAPLIRCPCLGCWTMVTHFRSAGAPRYSSRESVSLNPLQPHNPASSGPRCLRCWNKEHTPSLLTGSENPRTKPAIPHISDHIPYRLFRRTESIVAPSGELGDGRLMTLVVCLSYLVCQSRSPDVLLMEDAAYGLVTESLTGLAANARHFEPMGTIEQVDHSLCNLVNIPHFDKETIALANYCGDATDSRCRTGQPQAIASISTQPNVSASLGNTNPRARRMRLARSGFER